MFPTSSLHVPGPIFVDMTSDVWSHGYFSLNLILSHSSLANLTTRFIGLLAVLYTMEQLKKKVN